MSFVRLFVYLLMLRGQRKMLHEIRLVRIHRSRLNQGQNHPICNCRTTSTALTKCLLFVCTSLLTVSATCVLRVHTKGLVSTSRPRIIMSLVSVDLYTFRACLTRVLVRLIELKSIKEITCNICIRTLV